MIAFSFAKKLGDRLFNEWRGVDFDITKFPALAYGAITSSSPECYIDILKIPFSLLNEHEIPKQRSNQGSSFGQPPLTLYVAEEKRFFIEIYLWSSVDMTIHDHPFSGAFSVLEGVCQHDSYRFARSGGSSQIQTGILTLKDTELLSKGDCRMIFNGSRLIHRNLHLSKPTVTFIIRTYRDPGITGMIFDESGLAVAPDMTVVELKFLDYLNGVLRLHNYAKAFSLMQSLMASDFGDYAKFHSAEIYLERTRHYHEVELISEMLASAISDVPPEFFKKTFLLHKARYLSGDLTHSSY